MKIRFAPSALAFVFAAATVLRAQDAAAPAPAAAPASPDQAQAPAAAPAPAAAKKKTELEKRMSKIGKAYRKLKKQLADPAQNESSLQLLATMEDAAKEAVDLTPAKASDLPEDQRAKFVDDYKAGMKDLQDGFAKLEAALKAGDNAGAVQIAKDIDGIEKKNHKEFRRPEKD